MSGENKNFFVRTAAITAAALLVVFCVKIWIVDVLKADGKNSGDTRSAVIPGDREESEARWDKTKTKIDYKNAFKYSGKYVETEGTIAASYNNGRICYLNFDRDYKKYVALVIFADSYKKFPEKPEKYYLNKNIRVEGRIKEYKGRLEIVLGSPEQIKILK